MQSLPTAQPIPRHPPSRAGETRFPTSQARNRPAIPESPSARPISAPPRLRANKSLLLAPTHAAFGRTNPCPAPKTNRPVDRYRFESRDRRHAPSPKTPLRSGPCGYWCPREAASRFRMKLGFVRCGNIIVKMPVGKAVCPRLSGRQPPGAPGGYGGCSHPRPFCPRLRRGCFEVQGLKHGNA